MNDALLTRAEVMAKLGISATTLWRLIRDGRFPQPRKLTPQCHRWRESQLEEYLQSCSK